VFAAILAWAFDGLGKAAGKNRATEAGIFSNKPYLVFVAFRAGEGGAALAQVAIEMHNHPRMVERSLKFIL
jgi:hypothetical protein